jgi:hypothetical protein
MLYKESCIQELNPYTTSHFHPNHITSYIQIQSKLISQLKCKQVESSILYKEVMYIQINSHPLYKYHP